MCQTFVVQLPVQIASVQLQVVHLPIGECLCVLFEVLIAARVALTSRSAYVRVNAELQAAVVDLKCTQVFSLLMPV